MTQIKEVLKEKEIYQTWLAETTVKNCNSINEYARNVRQPNIEDLYKIDCVLNISVKELLIENE